jgi:hypothetical protein
MQMMAPRKLALAVALVLIGGTAAPACFDGDANPIPGCRFPVVDQESELLAAIRVDAPTRATRAAA